MRHFLHDFFTKNLVWKLSYIEQLGVLSFEEYCNKFQVLMDAL